MARVLVAMSGGVDSSVAAALLAREGHEVIGVTFNQWPASQTLRNARSGCCAPRTIDDARHVCQILGAPHYVLNFRAEFEAAVIQPLVPQLPPRRDAESMCDVQRPRALPGADSQG